MRYEKINSEKGADNSRKYNKSRQLIILEDTNNIVSSSLETKYVDQFEKSHSFYEICMYITKLYMS